MCHIEKQRMAACCDLNTFIRITGIDKIALKSILIEIQNISDMMLKMSVAVAQQCKVPTIVIQMALSLAVN